MRFFTTLENKVDEQLRTSLYLNSNFKKHKWNFFESQIVRWSSNYTKYSFLLLALYALTVASLVSWRNISPSANLLINRFQSLSGYEEVSLTAQLTIIAILYPMVVTVLGLLLNRKSAFKQILMVYTKYSGFMFAGLSGLILSSILVLSFFLHSYLSIYDFTVVLIPLIVWFASNILLSMWFFLQTFHFLYSGGSDVILRFSINETCEQDIRGRLKKLYADHSKKLGLLNTKDSPFLEVSDKGIFADREYRDLRVNVSENKSLYDINYSILKFAIALQTQLLRFIKKENQVIQICPERSHQHPEEYRLITYSNFDLNSIVSLLIKFSFKFKTNQFEENQGLTFILNGLIGSAKDALSVQSPNFRDFEETIEDLIKWHSELAKSLAYTNDEGKEDNWLFLESGFLLGGNYLFAIMREYYRLCKEATEKLHSTTSFFEETVRLHQRIYTSRNQLISSEEELLVHGSYLNWYLLLDWQSQNPSITQSHRFEEGLYEFIEMWEGWHFILGSYQKQTFDSYGPVISHLKHTSLMVATAIRYKDREAIDWAVDILNKWPDNFIFYDSWDSTYLWNKSLLNINNQKNDPNDPFIIYVLNGSEFDYAALQANALINLQIDTRVLLTSFILSKTSSATEFKDTIRDLLNGRYIKPGSNTGINQVSIDIRAFVESYLRQRDFITEGKNYQSQLSEFVRLYHQVDDERMISGRVYTGRGPNSLRDLLSSFVEVGIFLSSQAWTINTEVIQAINSDLTPISNRQILITELKEILQLAEGKKSSVLVDENLFEQHKQAFISSIDKLIEELEAEYQRIIIEHDISPSIQENILDSINQSMENSNFPLNLFRDRSEVNVPLEIEFTLPRYIYPRTCFFDDPDTRLDETDFKRLNEELIKHIKLEVLRKLISEVEKEVSSFKNIQDLINALIEHSVSSKNEIAFVGRSIEVQLKNYINRQEIRFSQVSILDGYGDSYICHIGPCPIYKLPFSDTNYCLFTSLHTFEEITFGKYNNDNFVELELFENEEMRSNLQIALIIKYSMEIEFASNAKSLILSVKDEQSEKPDR